MAYRALTAVLLGQSPPAQAGDLIPDTFSDMAGNPVAVDFERLVELGAAEEIEQPKRAARKAGS